jgi:glycerate 2-kinase
MSDSRRALLRRLFEAAIASAQPARCIPPYLPDPPAGRLLVIGAGKASAAMARAVEDRWKGPLSGLVVTRHGHAVACRQIEVLEAAHPVPDAAGLRAAQRTLDLVRGLTPDDLVLCLISGGGSALWPLPAEGITLADKQEVNRALLCSGATIGEINCVRRHLSAIKGGRLAAACHPARVLALLISDVPGDDPVDIASGPTVADPTTCEDALAILRRYTIDAPAPVIGLLESGRGQAIRASPVPRRASSPPRTSRLRRPRGLRAVRGSTRTSSVTPSRARRATSARRWRRPHWRWRGVGSRSRRPACCCLAAKRP